MCKQTLTIAICASTEVPNLSFTCSKLHMIVGSEVICDKAKGKCTCFVGTCGSIGTAMPTAALDLTELTKVRCAACTKKEDELSQRRNGQQILESPLLIDNGAMNGNFERHLKILKMLWADAECPYHPPTGVIASGGLASKKLTAYGNASEDQPLKTLVSNGHVSGGQSLTPNGQASNGATFNGHASNGHSSTSKTGFTSPAEPKMNGNVSDAQDAVALGRATTRKQVADLASWMRSDNNSATTEPTVISDLTVPAQTAKGSKPLTGLAASRYAPGNSGDTTPPRKERKPVNVLNANNKSKAPAYKGGNGTATNGNAFHKKASASTSSSNGSDSFVEVAPMNATSSKLDSKKPDSPAAIIAKTVLRENTDTSREPRAGAMNANNRDSKSSANGQGMNDGTEKKKNMKSVTEKMTSIYSSATKNWLMERKPQ